MTRDPVHCRHILILDSTGRSGELRAWGISKGMLVGILAWMSGDLSSSGNTEPLLLGSWFRIAKMILEHVRV